MTMLSLLLFIMTKFIRVNKDKANLLNNYFASQSNLHDDNAELLNLSINDEAPVLENISLHSHEVKDDLLSLK